MSINVFMMICLLWSLFALLSSLVCLNTCLNLELLFRPNIHNQESVYFGHYRSITVYGGRKMLGSFHGLKQ